MMVKWEILVGRNIMTSTLSDILLRANTALFAQKVTKSMEDFFGIQYEIQAKSLSKGFFKSFGTLTVVMHFSGKIQGDFIITTEEKNAEITLRNKGVLVKCDNETDARNYIADYFTEILNVSSGNTLPELEKKYGILLLTPPSVIFGELRLSQVISGNVDICNGNDLIRCTLSINLSGLSRKI
jgi:CheY-specific phosphatase CheX